MNPRLRNLLICLVLLPGLGLAGMGGLRVCLSAMVGGAECCAPDLEQPTCCSLATGEAEVPPAPGTPDDDPCQWCCVELEQGEPFTEGLPRTPVQLGLGPLALAHAPWILSGAERGVTPPLHVPRPPPGDSTSLPMRI